MIYNVVLITAVQQSDLIIYIHAAAAAKSLQSCLTLCNPIDGSPPGFPVPGILQARTLQWVAISFFYIYIYFFFLIFFSIMVYHRILNIVLCAMR